MGQLIVIWFKDFVLSKTRKANDNQLSNLGLTLKNDVCNHLIKNNLHILDNGKAD